MVLFLILDILDNLLVMAKLNQYQTLLWSEIIN